MADATQNSGQSSIPGGGAKPRGGVGKKIGIGLLVLVLLVGVAIAIAVGQVDSIVRTVVEKGGTHALGTRTTLAKADIGLFSGSLGMSGLGVANPEGFQSTEFFSLGDGAVEVTLPTLMKDVIEVPLIRFSTIRVNLEKSAGRTNYKVILDHLKSVTGEGKPDAPKDAGGEKKFIVQQVLIRDVRVHVNLVGGTGALNELAKVDIPIEEVKLENIGTADGAGVDLKTLAGVIIQAVLAAAAEKGDSINPEFMAELRGELAGLTAQLEQIKGLKGASLEVIGKSGEAAKQITETLKTDVQKAIETRDVEGAKKAGADAIEKAKEEGKQAVDRLKGLIPKKKAEEEKKDEGPK